MELSVFYSGYNKAEQGYHGKWSGHGVASGFAFTNVEMTRASLPGTETEWVPSGIVILRLKAASSMTRARRSKGSMTMDVPDDTLLPTGCFRVPLIIRGLTVADSGCRNIRNKKFAHDLMEAQSPVRAPLDKREPFQGVIAIQCETGLEMAHQRVEQRMVEAAAHRQIFDGGLEFARVVVAQETPDEITASAIEGLIINLEVARLRCPPLSLECETVLNLKLQAEWMSAGTLDHGVA